MLDQSFSSENFRVILDLENRKGVHVEDKLSIVNNALDEIDRTINDEDLKNYWGEDGDLFLRLRNSRLKIKSVKNLAIQ